MNHSIIEKNKKISTIKSILFYGIDYSIVKGLGATWKIQLSNDFISHLPSREKIWSDLGINKITYSSEKQILTKHTYQKKYNIWNTEKNNSWKKKQTENTSTKIKYTRKKDIKRKSVFDDYVSVRESFKEIRKR